MSSHDPKITTPKARISHTCEMCGTEIPAGTVYRSIRGQTHDNVYPVTKHCQPCALRLSPAPADTMEDWLGRLDAFYAANGIPAVARPGPATTNEGTPAHAG